MMLGSSRLPNRVIMKFLSGEVCIEEWVSPFDMFTKYVLVHYFGCWPFVYLESGTVST